MSGKNISFSRILILAAFFFSTGTEWLSAEIIVLRDGQRIRGEIIGRDDRFLTVRTAYQTRRIALYDVSAVEKEQSGLKKIYIYTRDTKIIQGYLVEEDSLEVQYKKTVDTTEVESISKLDILRMSGDEIRPIDLEFGLKPGIFYPMNSGKSKLSAAPLCSATVGCSSIFIRELRFVLEAGYTRSENPDVLYSAAPTGTGNIYSMGSGSSSRYLQIIPVTLGAEYRRRIPWNMEFSPRLGLGIALTEFSDGEGFIYSGTLPSLVAGFRLACPIIQHKLYAGIFSDYMMIIDSSGMLHSAMAGAFAAYRI